MHTWETSGSKNRSCRHLPSSFTLFRVFFFVRFHSWSTGSLILVRKYEVTLEFIRYIKSILTRLIEESNYPPE